jgi:hypothetical protein
MADELDGLYDGGDLTIGCKAPIGNRTLRHVKDFKPSDGKKRTAFTPVGAPNGRPIGYTTEPGAQEWELSMLPNTREVGIFRQLFQSGEKFKFTVQYKAGAQLGERIQGTVVVAEITEPEGDMKGEYGQTVKLGVIGEMQQTGNG